MDSDMKNDDHDEQPSATAEKYPNLIPFSRSNLERTIEAGRKGGIASGEARRRRKTLREGVIEYLNATLQPSHPKYAEITRMLRASGFLGPDEKPTNQHLIIFGLGQKAAKDASAFVALRDTAGEKPADIVGNIDIPAAPIVIGIHDTGFVEAERRKQAAEMAEIVASVKEALPAKEPNTVNSEPISPEFGETSAPTRPPSAPDTANRPTDKATPPGNPPQCPDTAFVSSVGTAIPPADETSTSPGTAHSPRPPHNHRPGKFVCIPAAFPRR